MHTDDVFVSTMLVDALHGYGQLTSPYAVDTIAEEIALLLASPEQPDAHARAKRIVESQFRRSHCRAVHPKRSTPLNQPHAAHC
ncbi:hypothetical protein [Streptomyces sp. NTK 937]|uniref:hypothetical protein n=1 Tax=Streptomyces sp. NTK 937 TaxID=1487711 RepID=UPI0004A8C360|nr:hypothetical protein [Streptomyces sp. NTK 937]KDQ65682.1 hypothetical protein DT87_31060 [Streptomyces sp. NTK 937]